MKRKLIWIGLGFFTLLIRYLTTPEWIEQYYSRGLFLWIRQFFDTLLTWFPLPLFYVFYLVLIGWIIHRISKTNWQKMRTWKGISQWGLSVLAFMGGTLFFFFFLWGFNYGRVPLVKQLGLKPQPVKLAALKEELNQTTDKLLALRKRITSIDSLPILTHQKPSKLEELCRASVEKTLMELDYPVAGRVRGRILATKGILLRFSSSGVYWPFVGEGNIDGGLHPIQQPFTLCHEISHGYGITNEGVCNFLAYLATQKSANAYIQYSGLVSYWRYIAISYQRFAQEEYWAFRKNLPIGFQKDLDAINKNLDEYPDILPRLRYVAYDSYLKSQGIAEGMQSYSSIIMLVRAWDNR